MVPHGVRRPVVHLSGREMFPFNAAFCPLGQFMLTLCASCAISKKKKERDESIGKNNGLKKNQMMRTHCDEL